MALTAFEAVRGSVNDSSNDPKHLTEWLGKLHLEESCSILQDLSPRSQNSNDYDTGAWTPNSFLTPMGCNP